MTTHRGPVLFVSMPESGLLNPMLVLAEELSRRGVEELYFATDDNRKAEVEATGARFVPLGDVISELSSVTWDDETYAAVTQRSRFKARRAVIEKTFVPRLLAAKYRRLEEAVEQIRPALMVVESMCLYGFQLAITKRIPYVLSNPFIPSNAVSSLVPVGKSYTPKDFPVPHTGFSNRMSLTQRLTNRLFRWRMLTLFLSSTMRQRNAEDAAVRAELGIDEAATGQMTRVEKAEFVLNYSIPELDYPFELPPFFRTVGALVPPLPQAEAGELNDWLDEHPSVVYLGFGTITRLTPAEVAQLVEVARRMPKHQFLWKLPTDQQRFLPAERPANLRVENWVPSQLDVLAHPNVKLFFTHGGGNAYHESLYFGKPMVMRPLWVDCYDQAVRGQDLGVSLTLDDPRTFRPDDVVDKLTRVLTGKSFRARAEMFGQLQLAAGGRARAADLVTELLAAPANV
ncbi:glycosyltransferase family 1 protein [Actinoplanes sp. LDG1-06]|uniref:Glycosyltransferase family 1 protein n=1 Tax=Paractinoplanes ovalisporus TaxID=2810368 RepID=A0ABS2AIK4_9ACTN|nr:glycosyltransferase [Actinoplanes ovalisporus]MBM2619674.1 glycosyltransferase family 1 protein [Actinoplanes ovalisporus]